MNIVYEGQLYFDFVISFQQHHLLEQKGESIIELLNFLLLKK